MKTLIFAVLLAAQVAWAGAPAQRTVPLFSYIEEVSDKLGVELSFSGTSHGDEETVVVVPPVDADHLMDQFLTVLFETGYALVPEPDQGGYQVMRQRDARDREIPFILDKDQLPDSDQLVTHAIHLKHFAAEGMARTMRSFMPATSRVIPIGETGILLITDRARAMRKYYEIIDRLDVPASAEESRAALKRMEKANECPPLPHGRGPGPALMIALFTLIGLLFGFLIRGYLIRRVEGGL